MTSEPLEIRQFIEAKPDVVFEFLVDPNKHVQWQGVAARFDARPGGAFWLNITDEETVEGKFVTIEPPRRVVFTWGWTESADVPPNSTTVEITLTPRGTGTDVLLTHHGLPPSDSGHQRGHHHYLARLSLAATGHDPGPDPWVKRPIGSTS